MLVKNSVSKVLLLRRGIHNDGEREHSAKAHDTFKLLTWVISLLLSKFKFNSVRKLVLILF